MKASGDTGRVMATPLGEAGGIGWQGKQTNLVSREFGSWMFLGSICLTARLEPDPAEQDHCGSCRACLHACPTDSFPSPYHLDARRCISYLTIENKGPIPREFRRKIGNRIYGCDDCLAVCPWNKFARSASEAKLAARDELVAPRLSELLTLDDTGFRALFSGSPVKRIGRDRFLRNVLIAAGNSGELTLAPICEGLLRGGSALVRGAAVWALSQLLGADTFADLATRHARGEDDPDVAAEWAEGRMARTEATPCTTCAFSSLVQAIPQRLLRGPGHGPACESAERHDRLPGSMLYAPPMSSRSHSTEPRYPMKPPLSSPRSHIRSSRSRQKTAATPSSTLQAR